jgi:hypothetical protein
LLAAGSATVKEVGQFKFTAIDDSAKITEITFANGSSTAPSAAADSIIAAVGLYDGTTLLDSESFISGQGKFIIPNGYVVPANTNKTLSVKVLLNSINNDAAATNKDIQVVLGTVKFSSSDGSVLPLQTVNLAANTFRVRKTVPTVALQTLPTTVLTAGDQVISKFSVTADASGDVTLDKVVLNVATTTGYDLSAIGNAVRVNGSTKNITPVLAGSLYTVTFASPEVISAGTTKTFEILANVAGSQTSGSVTSKIVEDAAYATDGSGTFVWSDGASISAETVSNGHRVPGLPTSTQTLTK